MMRRSWAASELANYAPKPRVVCGNKAFGGLYIQKQKRKEESAQLDFLSAPGVAVKQESGMVQLV